MREGQGRLVLLTCLLTCLLPGPAQAEKIKVSTWNLNWLTARTRAQADLPRDVHPRAPEDFARLAAYAARSAADIVAFQEVDGPQAATMVFDPRRYTVLTTDQNVTQRVGLAVRRDIAVSRNPDVSALDVEADAPHPLRDGLDATLTLPGGAKLRILVVHLKTGCQTQDLSTPRDRPCQLLAAQIPPLLAWIGDRAREGAAFLVMGDFNRVFDRPEAMGAALARAAPLTRATQGRANPCWDGEAFIDHIFAGGPARFWMVPDSLRVQLYRDVTEADKQRLSDHCPVSVMLDATRN